MKNDGSLFTNSDNINDNETGQNKSTTDNTLQDFNDLETLDENINASLNIEENYFANADKKQWFKTYFTFQKLSTRLEKDQKSNQKDILIHCSTVLNINPPQSTISNNVTEVIIDETDLNEFSIISPKFITKDFNNKNNGKTNFVLHNTGKFLKENKTQCKSLTKVEPKIIPPSPMKNTHLFTNFNLFYPGPDRNNQINNNEPNKSPPCKSRCHFNKCIKSVCQFQKSFPAQIVCKNSTIKTELHGSQNRYQNNAFKTNPTQAGENDYIMNKEEWHKFNTKGNSLCAFQCQLNRIRDKYVNINNNNNRNRRRITKSATEVNSPFCNNTMRSNREMCCGCNGSHEDKHCHSDRRNTKSDFCKCNCQSDLNQRTSGSNCFKANDRHNQCNECYPPCEKYPMRCNNSPIKQCQNQCYRNPFCCSDPSQFECFGEVSDNRCECQQTSSNYCNESHRSFRNKQTNNVSMSPEDSVKTVYCDTPSAQKDANTEECYCPCACRCSQFPKPAPYCLNSTYRMNYFQKCIPKFRRYRECDNLFLPLC